MKTSIDFTIDQMTKLFEELIKNIDTMSLDNFKDKKEIVRELSHMLLKTEIEQAFQAGVNSEMNETAEEYYSRNFSV